MLSLMENEAHNKENIDLMFRIVMSALQWCTVDNGAHAGWIHPKHSQETRFTADEQSALAGEFDRVGTRSFASV